MSKELIERIRAKKRNATDEEDDAADLIEAQQKRIDDMNSLCMFNERTMDDMLERLAASQTQIKVLREALDDFAHNWDCDNDAHKYGTPCRACAAEKALDQPTDDSALRELLKAERERVAKVFEGLHPDDWGTAASAIRTMEDQ